MIRTALAMSLLLIAPCFADSFDREMARIGELLGGGIICGADLNSTAYRELMRQQDDLFQTNRARTSWLVAENTRWNELQHWDPDKKREYCAAHADVLRADHLIP
jgi:hypothetical protein